MADKSQQTEKPTQRRITKAREEGNIPVPKQFVAAVPFMAAVAMLAWGGESWFNDTRIFTRGILQQLYMPDLTPSLVLAMAYQGLLRCLLPVVFFGLVLFGAILGSQLLATQGAVSGKKLTPNLKQLNPFAKITSLPRQNLFSMAQAAVMLPIFGWMLWVITRDNLSAFLALPLKTIPAAVSELGGTFKGLLWKAGMVFLVFGFIDYLRERRHWQKGLMMSKQEVKEEHKEMEGSPHVKARIRRMQRDLMRKQMMKAVPTATAVVTNPTHFAVAIRYDMETSGAPVVVAKGRDYLALRIRTKAQKHDIPIIENPPLARALYKSVKVGGEIPPALYKAVAEVLAYVYKLMHGLPT